MKFSVLVPVYNCENYLDECIRSILTQTYADFELLLLDDGSTDGSGNLCDRYRALDHRIKVFHQENRGIFESRIRLLRNATGDYVIWVDADDYIGQNLLTELYGFIKENKDIDCIIYDWCKKSGTGKRYIDRLLPWIQQGQYKVFRHENVIEVYSRLLNSKSLCYLWNKSIKTSIYADILDCIEQGKDDGIEDVVISSMVLPLCNNLGYIAKPYYFYRQNPLSLSHQRVHVNFEDYISDMRKSKLKVVGFAQTIGALTNNTEQLLIADLSADTCMLIANSDLGLRQKQKRVRQLETVRKSL